MSILEDKIKKNKDLFDAKEPVEGHFGRFKDKLKELHETDEDRPVRRILLNWRVAAVFIGLLAISATVLWLVPEKASNAAMAAELPEEVREVKFFYEEQTKTKLKQIDQCSSGSDDAGLVRQMIDQEMARLDENSADLEAELLQNADNERVKDALILNYKTKSDLLESVIYRLCNI